MSDVKLKCGCWAHVDCCDYVSRRIVENEEAQAVLRSDLAAAIARAEHLCVVANDLSARHTLALKWRQEYDALRASLAALVEDMQEKVDHSHYTQNTRAIYYMAARSIEVALERSRDDED